MREDPTLTEHEKQLEKIVTRIIEDYGRTGKKEGVGFYTYPENAKKYVWPEWKNIFPTKKEYDVEEVGKRLLFAMVIDAYKCLDAGVIKEPKDADVGSILGLGFPIHTGGVMSYIDYIGAVEFAGYSAKLATKYGERFKVPESLKALVHKANGSRIFYKN